MRIFTSAKLLLSLLSVLFIIELQAQETSVARKWNYELLDAIRRDFARPPVHSRNLFQVSAVLYDAWAAYRPDADPYLLGRTRGSYVCPFDGAAPPADIVAAQEEAMSFAAYRLLSHRFQNSPGHLLSQESFDNLMDYLGYDISNTSVDYLNGGPSELGNYIAEQMIAFGYVDGSNESLNYVNQYYEPINPSIHVEEPGNPDMIDPNRWQIITLTNAIDQSGNPVPSSPPALGPEWGNVVPFAISDEDITVYNRDGHNYIVYHDPGDPALLDVEDPAGLESHYKWNFCMVSVWQSLLDPGDGVTIDISPASKGNIQSYPTSMDDYDEFYNYFEGGDIGEGYTINPITNAPYEPQIVKRGDFTRILAEFWADGPQSETPPGHWFTILNTVMDHPLFENKWLGEGEELSDLEYDVKAYLSLGGAMHDAAITAWGIKGWYDYVRPVSAIRYMSDQGQCSDPELDNFDPAGLPIIPGYIEVVLEGDDLAGDANEHVGKMKLFTWRGPDYIEDPETDIAGVGWILAENWWPYQRPTFVTPPFSGYVSGHSTFSRTAAEVLTLMTGSEYFPGGMSNFVAPQNEFLEFEEGPTEDIILQWATYRDASDQCSLSRIYGGIHPPVDDIPGRFLGMELGPDAFNFANALFNSDRPVVQEVVSSQNQININDIESTFTLSIDYDRSMNTTVNPQINFPVDNPLTSAIEELSAVWLDEDSYEITYNILDTELHLNNIYLTVDSAVDINGEYQNIYLALPVFSIDTEIPEISLIESTSPLINDELVTTNTFSLLIQFDEACQTSSFPNIELISTADLSSSLVLDTDNSQWTDNYNFNAVYTIFDNEEEVDNIGVEISNVQDLAGNPMEMYMLSNLFTIDTRNPILTDINISNAILNQQNVGNSALVITLAFDEIMNTALDPIFQFNDDNPVPSSLTLNVANSFWIDEQTYQRTYDLLNTEEEFFNISIELINTVDLAGNLPDQYLFENALIIDTKRPSVFTASTSTDVVSDTDQGSASFQVMVDFEEVMDPEQSPLVQISSAENLFGTFVPNFSLSSWIDNNTFEASFNISDANIEVEDIDILVSFGKDISGNSQFPFSAEDAIIVDTKNPDIMVLNASTYTVTNDNLGSEGFSLISIFNEPMNTSITPIIEFGSTEEVSTILSVNESASTWLNNFTYQSVYDVNEVNGTIEDINLAFLEAIDEAGNILNPNDFSDYFSINLSMVGLMELLRNNDFTIYPNPISSGEVLKLNLKDPMGDASLTVYDVHGKLVFESYEMNLNIGVNEILHLHIPAGLYFINIQNSESRISSRVIFSD